MNHTDKFRLFPTPAQEKVLNAIFTIYNHAKRKGYTLLVKGEANIQRQLKAFCGNNSYVNTILIENETKLKQQETWLGKQEAYLGSKVDVIREKIIAVKSLDGSDRRLRGLYARLSSLQHKKSSLTFKPLTFGSKRLFRDRLLQKISRQEFRIRRDASFCCVGKRQVINANLKVLPSKELRIRIFNTRKGRKWLNIPFSVNGKQENWFRAILGLELYTVTVKRMFIKKELRYYMHVSYEVPEPAIKFGFETGGIGLDFNYNHLDLTNIDRHGKLVSYLQIPLRNLYSYRKTQRSNYISFKLDKVLNYCMNKRKGIVLEDLSFKQSFSYNKNLNRKLAIFQTTALDLLKRKCIKKGVAYRKVFPGYTSQIAKYKYSRLHNLSIHILASYVIARRGLRLQEDLPPIYQWLLSQVGDLIKPRLKKSSTYYNWARIHDFFKHSGITSFRPSEIVEKVLSVKNGLNSVTNAQPDNLRAGLSRKGKIENYHKFWYYMNNTGIL
jgi:IS605 OrfB family transposase